MHFSTSFLFALLSGAAFCAPVEKRTAATIESDIATISSELTTANSDITAFTGSLLQALILLTVFDTLESDITTTTSDITSTGTLSAADSETIAADISSLTTQVVSVLAEAEAKTSVVSSAGYSSEVLSALNTLQTDADALYAALESTISSDYTSEITSLQASVDDAFATAIADY